MLCEPIYHLPQKFNFEDLRGSAKPYDAVQQVQLKTENYKKTISKLHTEYKILPIFGHQSEHITTILSLKSNEYLLGKWHGFLEHAPKHFVEIHLYADYRKNAIVPGRRQLNGQFYGVDNKLAPIPYIPNPRQYDVIYPDKCQRSLRKSK